MESKTAGFSLELRIDELREILKSSPPHQLAELSGAAYSEIDPGRGEFRLSLLDIGILLPYPSLKAYDLNDDPLPNTLQALVLYYFVTANGAALTGKWVSFADLPDGRMYAKAFQGYSGDEIVKVYGVDANAFKDACKRVGGEFNKICRCSLHLSWVAACAVIGDLLDWR